MREPFRIRLAGRVFEISPLYDDVRKHCGEYEIDDPDVPTDFSVAADEQDIVRERELSLRADRLLGRPENRYSPGVLENTAIYRKIAGHLLDCDTLLMHGSCVALHGEAFLFTARSGTGKSTHTGLWRQIYPDAVMVNDDKPLLRITGDGVLACGSPWSGKTSLNSNIEVPLKAVCILERDRYNHIQKIDFREMYPTLLAQLHRPADPAKTARVLVLADLLAARGVEFYRLGCNMQPEAARVSHDGMTERKQDDK